MKRVKLLHCADVHLDMPFTSVGNLEGRSAERRQELKLAFSRIINVAREENVDLLLICGDLFEHSYVKKSTITFLNDQFAQIPDIHVFIITGNHDPFLSDSYYKNFKWNENVHIFSGLPGSIQLIELCGLGVCIYGNVPDEQPVNHSNINILMAHGTLGMDFTKNPYNPISGEALAVSGMDYIALGHFHNMFREAGPGRLFFNPGSPEPLGFDEEGEHGIFITSIEKSDEKSDSNKRITDVRFIPLNKRQYRNIPVNVDGCSNDESIAGKISEAINSAGASEDLYNICLRGNVSGGFRINTGIVEGILKDEAFFIKIKDDTRPDYDLKEIVKEPGLRGLFVRKMLERAEKAESETAKSLVMQALYYGLEAIDQGEINVY